jgi:hypothetical protein
MHNQYLAKIKKFGRNRWLRNMLHPLHKFVIQMNALKPALAGIKPKSLPSALLQIDL